MEPPPDNLGRLMNTISGVCGPATKHCLPLIQPLASVRRIDLQHGYSFKLLCTSLKNDAEFFWDINISRTSQCFTCALRVHKIYETATQEQILNGAELFHIHLAIAAIAIDMKDFTAA
ncbi:hypothetical protein EGW08_004098, partial [Elysia chlorotica]